MENTPEPKTKVIFKIERNPYYTRENEVIAFFPQIPGTPDPYTCLCYARFGQHGSARVLYAAGLTPATPEQYADLYKELTESIGYNLEIGHKFTQRDLKIRRAELARIERS